MRNTISLVIAIVSLIAVLFLWREVRSREPVSDPSVVLKEAQETNAKVAAVLAHIVLLQEEKAKADAVLAQRLSAVEQTQQNASRAIALAERSAHDYESLKQSTQNVVTQIGVEISNIKRELKNRAAPSISAEPSHSERP